MTRYLITGGAGFIGSSIAKHLIDQGNFVRVMDNLSFGSKDNLDFAQNLDKDRFEFYLGDITNVEDCKKACKGIDVILHHAALRSVVQSVKEPLSYNHVNVDGLLFMLQAAVDQNVKRLVFASSAAIYGDNQDPLLKEDHLPLLLSPYALSKLTGEYYCRIFSGLYGIETVCLRYFNVFGPKQSLDDEYAVVIPKFIHCLINDQQPPIFGDGLQSRDFIYIDNLIQANILAATTPNIKHEVLNVARGVDITILELVDILNKTLGKKIAPAFLPKRPGDIYKTRADISKMERVLNYKPVFNFEDGIKQTVEYFKEKWLPANAA